MPEGWEDQWQVIREIVGEGGQGVVAQVRNKATDTLGALKRLHVRNINSTERRFRMQVEVNALRALAGNRVPAVLDTNVGLWEDKSVRLYVVMEWIEGPTLSRYVQGSQMPLDDALIVIGGLMNTIEECHTLEIYHRDLKPDNIILRHEDIRDPMLIDFGMAWAKPLDDEPQDDITGAGDEIGNRFLRLPEHAAERHLRDSRSDLTVLVGLVLYMITGRQPRVLEDANARMPHQFLADRIPQEVTEDPRWPLLERLFRIGFQKNIDLRFQSSEQLRGYFERLNNPGGEEDGEMLALEIARMDDLLNSPEVVLPKLAGEHVPKVMSEMQTVFAAEAEKAGFAYNFNTAFVSQPDLVGSNDLFGIYKLGFRDLGAQGDHQIRLESNLYRASYRVEPFERIEYYRGSALDPESLEDAVRSIVPRILKDLVRVYSGRLSDRFSIPK